MSDKAVGSIVWTDLTVEEADVELRLSLSSGSRRIRREIGAQAPHRPSRGGR